ncbi:GNAT family N-acetyltransferase [Streptomyces sp. NPDC059982]|uniref:GNAT family N-acetyltransferase n=1 Tax=unclassified Streptomyces TaxID=2593676 RepID=UPI00343E45B6
MRGVRGGEEVEWVAELKAAVMRRDLERLGRYDHHRARQRVRDSFGGEHSRVIEAGGRPVGSLTVRPGAGGGLTLEHFYLDPAHQGRGIGTRVLEGVLAAADAEGAEVRLTVLRGSAARGLYERYGFTVEDQDEVDVHMVRAVRAGAAGPGGS